MKDINPLKISNSVYWTGILDEDLVTFDIVMETRYGTTYNSYFIDADKKALIDTVKLNFSDLYLNKVKRLADHANIEYIITSHTEPDHSGSIARVLELYPDATVVGSGQALNYLQEMINRPFKSIKIKDGDTLSLGNKTLRFIGAPNLHWPDSIYTYLEDDRILFTCDSFGAHFCDENIFDDKTGDYTESFRYYFDVILRPYSKFMLKAIEKIRPLEISMICPGHGPVLRSSWKKKVDLSEKLSREYINLTSGSSNQVLVTYISAYGYTKQMAEVIASGIRKTGDIKVDVADIEHISPGDLEEKIVRSGGILVGSPTINQNTLLPVYRLFAVINPIRDKGKYAASFGSYGWSGEAVTLIENHLKNLKLNVIQSGLAIKFQPGKLKTEELVLFGENFGRQFLEKKVEKVNEN
jgi:NADH oxidase (H2O-forming)